MARAPGWKAGWKGWLLLCALRCLADTTTPDNSAQHAKLVYQDASSCVMSNSEGMLVGWSDAAHCYFSWRANSLASWVNGWFTGPDLGSDLPLDSSASSLVTLREGVGWDAIQGMYNTHSVSTRLDLPAAEKRFAILLENNQQDINPSEIGAPSPLQLRSPATSAGAVALRWRGVLERYTGATMDLGLRGGFDAFLRLRYHRTLPLSRDYVFNFHQVVVESSKTEMESLTMLDIERRLDEHSVLRLSSNWDWQQQQRDLGEQWVQALTVSHEIGSQASISGGLSVSGITHPSPVLLNWGPGLSYRRNIWRPWLYLDLRPAYTHLRYAPAGIMGINTAHVLADASGTHIDPAQIFLPRIAPRWAASMEVAFEVLFGQ